MIERMMENVADLIFHFSAMEAFLSFLILNIFIFCSSVLFGNLMQKFFTDKRVCEIPAPITLKESFYCISTVILNSAVTLIGWYLWKMDIIKIKSSVNLHSILDIFVLFFSLDFSMYVLHRIAHLSYLYPLIHKTHHNYKNVRPASLFVLNPLENLSFGFLWLSAITVYPTYWISITAFLTLNLLFGTLGHLGVEPFPEKIKGNVLMRFFTTSSFHAFHHSDPNHNFGFYTLVWDRIFKTSAVYYEEYFGKIPDLKNKISVLIAILIFFHCSSSKANPMEIRDSLIPGAGKGVFAVTDIPKGTVIGEYTGKFITYEEYVRLAEKNEWHYVMGLLECAKEKAGGYTLIDGRFGNITSRINYAPVKFQNVKFVKICEPPFVNIISLRDIKSGEELYIDYGPAYDYSFMKDPKVRKFFKLP